MIKTGMKFWRNGLSRNLVYSVKYLILWADPVVGRIKIIVILLNWYFWPEFYYRNRRFRLQVLRYFEVVFNYPLNNALSYARILFLSALKLTVKFLVEDSTIMFLKQCWGRKSKRSRMFVNSGPIIASRSIQEFVYCCGWQQFQSPPSSSSRSSINYNNAWWWQLKAETRRKWASFLSHDLYLST